MWDASWVPPFGMFSGHDQLGGDIRADTKLAAGIAYLVRLMIPQEELQSIAVERDIWNTLHSLLPP